MFQMQWCAYGGKSDELLMGYQSVVIVDLRQSQLEDYISVEKGTLKVHSLKTALVMAVKGLGIAVLPSWITGDQLKLGSLIEKDMQELSRIPDTRICAVTRHRGDPSVSMIVKALKEHCSRVGLRS